MPNYEMRDGTDTNGAGDQQSAYVPLKIFHSHSFSVLLGNVQLLSENSIFFKAKTGLRRAKKGV